MNIICRMIIDAGKGRKPFIAANSSDYVKLQELSDKKELLEQELSEKMERWVYLNDLAERIARGETV